LAVSVGDVIDFAVAGVRKDMLGDGQSYSVDLDSFFFFF
jgi:hypothetical protein